jgi:predicted TIM-barrel enzyme
MEQAKPLDFLTYRAQVGADQIKLIAEVHSMYCRWPGDRPTAAVARMAARIGADAVEVAHADEDTNARPVREINQARPDLPVILGGHTPHDNVACRLAAADGVFVGSCLTVGSRGTRVDIERVRDYVRLVTSLQ